MQVKDPIDIFLSHDWTLGITYCGNVNELIRQKPFLKNERTLGSKPAAQLLQKLKPVFPGRKFLQIVDIDSAPGPHKIMYDEEWLAITRKFNSLLPLTIRNADYGAVQLDIQDCRKWVKARLLDSGNNPFKFLRTVPCYNPAQRVSDSSTDSQVFNLLTFCLAKRSLLERFKLFPWECLCSQESPDRIIFATAGASVLDLTSESRESLNRTSSIDQPGAVDHNNEEIPIDNADESEEHAEDEP